MILGSLSPTFFYAGVISVILPVIVLLFKVSRTTKPPFPPGPKPWPFIGNILQLNTAEPWLTYTKWKKQFGEVLHVRLLGQDFVILNSERAARALLDQKSSIYSDRPVISTADFYGVGWNTVLLPYGNEWRLHRKLFRQSLLAESTDVQRQLYQNKAHTLVTNLLETPESFEAHIKGFVASIVLALAHGYEIASLDDPMFIAVKELVALLEKGLSPERAAVLSAFPFLGQLPTWFPGSVFKREAVQCRRLGAQVLEAPFNLVKQQLAAGTATPCLVADCLTNITEKDDPEKYEAAIKGTAGTIFCAGFETSSASLQSFILAMLLYPEVQTKAQAEIDAVIGISRLPTFEDRASLPYIDAILRELFRWVPSVPLGIPHATTSDDVYEGYFIPKGAVIVPNVWAMTRDEDKYENIEDFIPERHFTANGSLDSEPISNLVGFGLGRRICPGRFASESLMWIAMVSILATFRIVKAKDANGQEIGVKKELTHGIAIHPVPFPCTFISRSEEREEAVRASGPLA
ncbi:hypothetical protein HYDPIDRAFT_147886 [Hydnomerulius pinastri MD-312]|nr:hypothetical protein HYDPIDRAFT_147886 [Hydnomerulius pinastri MD-312]